MDTPDRFPKERLQGKQEVVSLLSKYFLRKNGGRGDATRKGKNLCPIKNSQLRDRQYARPRPAVYPRRCIHSPYSPQYTITVIIFDTRFLQNPVSIETTQQTPVKFLWCHNSVIYTHNLSNNKLISMYTKKTNLFTLCTDYVHVA